ncbi:GNAT family N-acetyltransferase [Paracoccus onubensis]|uniref:GNAT family N-acetyltransferase n=1 Tax=Paracoccus onubensis TaxID=1675788 RepID=A0A418SXX9_9RHOB|nr:GNAT family N-acetyltransferase [Paracoccus onubensis]RJE85760.1 GNAT family N-acetyltransferase [Paracoccus onubensis]
MPPILGPGFHDVLNDHIVTVVTSLEMRAAPAPRPEYPASDLRLALWRDPDPGAYRALFRLVGEDWLWCSRLLMTDEKLTSIIHDPRVEIRRLDTPEGSGLLELDFRTDGECELAFFGLSAGLVGSGAGRWMMNRALEIAWSRPLTRLWVHTCTMDHPGAVAFYRRSGFVPFRRQIEIMPDPRISGLLPETAAPHIPCLPVLPG